MTFRELLDKYRAGQASEEERAMVEAELEKSEAIADYLAEQVEDALGAAETQAPAGEVRHIQKKVNRRLRRTAVWAACIVLAVLLGGRFVVGPLVSSLYYQPNAYTVGGMEDRAPASLVKENGVEVETCRRRRWSAICAWRVRTWRWILLPFTACSPRGRR